MKINVKAINEAIRRNNEEFAFIPNKYEIEDIELIEVIDHGYGRDNVIQNINVYLVTVGYKAKKYEPNAAVYKVYYYETDKEASALFENRYNR